MTTLKELKKGDIFTLKAIEKPFDSQVWIKGDYDRSLKAFSCINYADANRERFFKASREIFTEFTF